MENKEHFIKNFNFLLYIRKNEQVQKTFSLQSTQSSTQ